MEGSHLDEKIDLDSIYIDETPIQVTYRTSLFKVNLLLSISSLTPLYLFSIRYPSDSLVILSSLSQSNLYHRERIIERSNRTQRGLSLLPFPFLPPSSLINSPFQVRDAIEAVHNGELKPNDDNTDSPQGYFLPKRIRFNGYFQFLEVS